MFSYQCIKPISNKEFPVNDLKIWYMSTTVWGGVVAILASCANFLGLDVTYDDQTGFIDWLTALAAAAGGLLAIWGRISARTRLR
jgi:hypothetical protein